MPPSSRKKPRKALTTYLENRYGRHSEKLIRELEKIAFGEAFEESVPGLPGVVKTTYPSIDQRHAAILDLLAYQHGRPTQSIEVDVEDRRPRLDVDRLTMEELEAMDRIARKATVVEGELVHPLLVAETGKVKS